MQNKIERLKGIDLIQTKGAKGKMYFIKKLLDMTDKVNELIKVINEINESKN